MKKTSRSRVLAAFVAAGTLLAACGGDDDADEPAGVTAADSGNTDSAGSTEEPTDNGSGDAGEPAATAPEDSDDGGTAAAGAPRGGEVVFGATNETASLDPLDHGRASTTSFPLHMFYDSLTEITPAGEVVPFLAESVEPNEDATVWTVTLRDGVQFHDGTPLDADAVIYSIERFRNDEAMGQSVFGVKLIESLTAVDDLTVEITLTESVGAFPIMLALTPGFPVSPTAVEAMGREQFAQNGAVGTGPFKLVERTIDSQTVGERNENYWRENEPHLDRFVYRPLVDAETRFVSVQTGDVDIIQSNIGRQLADAAADDALDVAVFEGNGGNSIVFNLREAPVNDVRVRQAMAHAINRDVINQVLYAGTMIETCGPFAPSSVWHAEAECFDYDPDRARELIAEYTAETGNPVEINFLCSTNAGLPEQTELMFSFWSEVGIDVTIDQVDPLAQLERVRADPPQFQTMCWFGDFNTDPDERLRTFYASDSSGAQRDGYSNPVVDAAFDVARVSTDFDERYEQYAIIQRELAKDLPHIYWTVRLDGAIFDQRVRGVEIVPGGGFWPGRIWLEE